MTRGIRRNPTAFMYKPKESTERFKLLPCRNVPVFSGGTKSTHPIYVEFGDKREPLRHGKILQLAEQQAVFVERRLAQVSRLSVNHKLIAGLLDGQWFRLFDSLALSFPLADKILCPLPVAESE